MKLTGNCPFLLKYPSFALGPSPPEKPAAQSGYFHAQRLWLGEGITEAGSLLKLLEEMRRLLWLLPSRARLWLHASASARAALLISGFPQYSPYQGTEGNRLKIKPREMISWKLLHSFTFLPTTTCPPGQGPLQPTVGDPASAGGLD